MAKKRKDKAGLVLRKGEYLQGNTYLYRYTVNKKRFTVCAGSLVELRQKEDAVQRDLMDGIRTDGDYTLSDMFRRYMSLKNDLKENTKQNYLMMWKKRIGGSKLADTKIIDIKKSDVQMFINDLMNDNLHKSTVKYILNLIRGSLQIAVDDDFLRKNPAVGVKYEGDTDSRDAFSREEQQRFLEFLRQSRFNNYLPLVEFMLYTGVRASELCGLIPSDIDEINGRILVKRQLQYLRGKDGKYKFAISAPKTEAGVRMVPLTIQARKALSDWKRMKKDLGITCETAVDGVSGFIFCSQNGSPLTVTKLNFYLANAVKAHNKDCEDEMRPVSCHILRHSFCTRQIEDGQNPKVLAQIMGHSSCDITLAVYTNIEMNYACNEVRKIADAKYQEEQRLYG